MVLLGERWGARELLNLGSGGATVDLYLAQRDRIIEFAPERVTVLPFSDLVRTSAARFTEGYAELFAMLGGAQIYFGDLRIAEEVAEKYGPRDREVVAEKNACVAELAARFPAMIVVPVFDQNVAHPEWNASDGHPNDLGHAYLADSFARVISP